MKTKIISPQAFNYLNLDSLGFQTSTNFHETFNEYYLLYKKVIA